MIRTSYFTYIGLVPSQDVAKVAKFCRDTSSYSLYSIEEVRAGHFLVEGCLVFSKKITIFEASSILTGFTVSYTDCFDSDCERILSNKSVRVINEHPLLSLKINLIQHFD